MQFDRLKRREFITLLGSVVVACPFGARAQQAAMPMVGYLHPGAPEDSGNRAISFRKGLSEAGLIEGQNVIIEFRWAHHDIGRLAELAADLVRHRASVIVTPGSTPATLAAKAATSTIPIVFAIAGDPVQMGLVASLNRPGGNISGFSAMITELAAKRLEILHELLPAAKRFAALVNPTNPTGTSIADLRTVAATNGWEVYVFNAGSAREINVAFAGLLQIRADALLVPADALFFARRIQLATLSARHSMPGMFSDRYYVEAGGLMSYGTDISDAYRQVGIYAGRILKGDKPADLPVLQPTKFELVINLQTAMAIGTEVPPTLLARADEIIE
jgi:putative ABC transport system substrate-binding protein